LKDGRNHGLRTGCNRGIDIGGGLAGSRLSSAGRQQYGNEEQRY
jgi:hypothetical protein